MTTPSILRHSKAHRAAVERNAKLEASKWEERLTLECRERDAKELFGAIRSTGVRLISHCMVPWDGKSQFIVALRGGANVKLVLPNLFKVVKTEKVRL